MRAFNLRVQFRRLNRRACERALISQPGFETSSLRSHVFPQPLLLFCSDGFQRPIVNRGVKRQARRVQLLHDSNIQLLLRNQDLNISPPQRGQR
jgi:hypothetical protein